MSFIKIIRLCLSGGSANLFSRPIVVVLNCYENNKKCKYKSNAALYVLDCQIKIHDTRLKSTNNPVTIKFKI